MWNVESFLSTGRDGRQMEAKKRFGNFSRYRQNENEMEILNLFFYLGSGELENVHTNLSSVSLRLETRGSKKAQE